MKLIGSLRRLTLASAAIAALSCVAPSASASDIGVTLSELEAFNSLTSSSPIISGITTLGTDHWQVGFVSSFNVSLNSTYMSWSEDGGSSVNVIHAITSGYGGSIDVLSDVSIASDPASGGICGVTSYPLNAGTTCFIGTTSSDSYYMTIVEATPTPEPASLSLLGLGLVGFGIARRRKRKIAAA